MTTETGYVAVQLAYSKPGELASAASLAGKPVQGFQITPAAATAGAGWYPAHTAANALSQSTGLYPGKKYAVKSVAIYGSTGIAFYLSHADFGGCTPGGLQGYAVGQLASKTDFSKIYGVCPVFSSNSPLTVYQYDSTTGTPTQIDIEVVQID